MQLAWTKITGGVAAGWAGFSRLLGHPGTEAGHRAPVRFPPGAGDAVGRRGGVQQRLLSTDL